MESINNSEAVEKLDARWFHRFETVNFEDYDKLSGDKEVRAVEKSRFLSGEVDNPTLDYPKLEEFDFDLREQELMSLKLDVMEQEPNPPVKRIYQTKVNEALAMLRMLRAAKAGDDKKFSRYADFIYGKLDSNSVDYVVNSVCAKAELVVATSKNEQKIIVAQQLLELFNQVRPAEINGISADVLPKGLDIKGDVTDAEEAKRLFEIALRELDTEEWSVVVDTESGLNNFRVSQESREVVVPESEQLVRRKLTSKKFKGLIEHEIKTHVARRVNGERSKLQLLGLGLDRYIQTEEGVATFNEQQVTGAKEFAGIPRYFSIAVAKGLAGEARDFRQTFEIMKLYRLVNSVSEEMSEERAAELAYDDCVRIFRGTTGNTPGAIYPKDKVYFSNRAIWQLVENDSEAIYSFSLGKYDSTNPEHVALLSELGILDSDLAQLN